MWLRPALILALFLLLILVSIHEISKNFRKNAVKQIPSEVIPGAISQALAYLVGVAGGIYLSLVMLTSFLKITLPQSILLLGVEVDPLATISLLLAILQPWINKVLELLKDK